MPHMKMLTGWTLALTLGFFLGASPALAKDRKLVCERSCAASNTVGEQCVKGCPPAEGSTGDAYKRCSKRCAEKSEESFNKCVSKCIQK